MTGPHGLCASDLSDADDVERRPCPKCDAQPGSPCRWRSGAVASAYHTGRFTKVPRLAKLLLAPTPAGRAPGQPWRPATPPPAPIDPDLPGADIRIGYARCSHRSQELGSQLDALTQHGIPRDEIFSEKISTRIRVRPQFEKALKTARESHLAVAAREQGRLLREHQAPNGSPRGQRVPERPEGATATPAHLSPLLLPSTAAGNNRRMGAGAGRVRRGPERLREDRRPSRTARRLKSYVSV
ncbi:recombinase family protein [Streptomyces sp. NPDC059651]